MTAHIHIQTSDTKDEKNMDWVLIGTFFGLGISLISIACGLFFYNQIEKVFLVKPVNFILAGIMAGISIVYWNFFYHEKDKSWKKYVAILAVVTTTLAVVAFFLNIPNPY